MQKTINKYSLNRALVVIGTLLYPIYALPWIIKSMINNEKLGYVLFSLSMGYFAYLMIPYYDFDLVRHYDDFRVMSNTNFADIFMVDPRIKHYFFNVYMWGIHQLGLPKEFVPFSMTYAKYMFLFMSLREVVKNYPFYSTEDCKSKKWLLILAPILVICSVQFVRDVSGLRNNLAFAIYIYAIIKYYFSNKRIQVYLLFAFSSLIHLSIIPLILIFFISIKIRYIKIWRIVFIVSFFVLVLGISDKIFFYIIGSLKPFLVSKGLYFSYYMDPNAEWGAGYFNNKGIVTLIFEKYFRPSVFYLAGIYLLFEKKLTFDKIRPYMYIAFSFIVLISISRTMFDRYTYFFKFLFILVFLIDYMYKPLTKFKKIFFYILVVMILLTKSISIYRYGVVYITSWYQTLYVPAPIMLLRTVDKNMYITEPYIGKNK